MNKLNQLSQLQLRGSWQLHSIGAHSKFNQSDSLSWKLNNGKGTNQLVTFHDMVPWGAPHKTATYSHFPYTVSSGPSGSESQWGTWECTKHNYASNQCVKYSDLKFTKKAPYRSITFNLTVYDGYYSPIGSGVAWIWGSVYVCTNVSAKDFKTRDVIDTTGGQDGQCVYQIDSTKGTETNDKYHKTSFTYTIDGTTSKLGYGTAYPNTSTSDYVVRCLYATVGKTYYLQQVMDSSAGPDYYESASLGSFKFEPGAVITRSV